YGQVVGQFRRYMGHVSNNIGGVYEHYKTADQSGAVYTHVPREHQKNCMKFMQEELFKTPDWLIDEDIFGKIEYSGSVERIRSVQIRYLNNILHLGKMARIIENESLNGSEAYGLVEMMTDLRTGIWSELRSRRPIDTYRRNLQKAYIERLEYLMTAGPQKKLPDFGGYRKSTVVNTSQSDIRSLARAELNNTARQIRRSLPGIQDKMTRYHLEDVQQRIEDILNPR
ncbi:MAG: zinc-dependent metalloprotease, partial [Bacteroidota bacterium]